jgi:hypothetical protein
MKFPIGSGNNSYNIVHEGAEHDTKNQIQNRLLSRQLQFLLTYYPKCIVVNNPTAMIADIQILPNPLIRLYQFTFVITGIKAVFCINIPA